MSSPSCSLKSAQRAIEEQVTNLQYVSELWDSGILKDYRTWWQLVQIALEHLDLEEEKCTTRFGLDEQEIMSPETCKDYLAIVDGIIESASKAMPSPEYAFFNAVYLRLAYFIRANWADQIG